MAYTAYSNYLTMHKINEVYYYSRAFKNSETLTIMVDGDYFIPYNNYIGSTIICELISIALYSFNSESFGYFSGGGRVRMLPPVPKLVIDRELYTDYFVKTNNAVIQLGNNTIHTITPVDISGINHVNMNDLADALGFTFSMEKDDGNSIQLLKVVKN
jgi:hypothetical protein